MSKIVAGQSATAPQDNSTPWPKSESHRSLLVFSQFVGLGPPVGCIALFIFIPLYHILAVFAFRTFGIYIEPDFFNNYFHERALESLPALPIFFFVGLFTSYFLGGIQATITGLISAFWSFNFRSLPIYVPLAASILPISVYILLNPTRLATGEALEDPARIPYLLALIGFIHLSASGICWFRTRSYFKQSFQKS